MRRDQGPKEVGGISQIPGMIFWIIILPVDKIQDVPFLVSRVLFMPLFMNSSFLSPWSGGERGAGSCRVKI